MTTLNVEASRLGEAPNAEIYNQIRHKNSSSDNLFIVDSAPKPNAYSDVINACLAHMEVNGIPLNGELRIDGRFHRFSIDKKKTQRDEWYIANAWSFKGKEFFSCHYGSWSTGNRFRFQSWDDDEGVRGFSSDERKEIASHLEKQKNRVQEEINKRHEEVASEAQGIWKKALQQPTNEGQTAYLTKKGVQAYGVRFGKNPRGYDCLIIPLMDIESNVRSLQFISVGEDGTTYKTFLSGGEKKGYFAMLGDPTSSASLFIVEGYSTGASVHEATRIPTVIAFDCNNLEPVIAALRNKYRKHDLIIAADDDRKNPNNPGRSKAQEAARKHSCRVVFPAFQDDFCLPNGELPTDYNDLHLHYGLQAVREQLADPWYKGIPVPFREVPYQMDVSKLPEEFRRAVLEQHRFIKSPLETIETMGLVVVCAAIGKSAIIEEVPGLEHHPKLAFVNVLAQGERKSQSFKNMAKELDEYERSRKKDHEAKVKAIKSKNRLVDEEIKDLRGNKRSGGNHAKSFDEILGQITELEARKEPIPPTPKIYTTDTTEQRLFELMADRNGEFAVLAGEGRAIINTILGAYSNGTAADSIYLSGISGDKITRDRIGQGERIELSIDDPCLNIGIMIQPDKWVQMARNTQLQESGFLARLFVIQPPSKIGERETKPGERRGVNREEVQPFHDKIRLILENRDRNREKNHTHKVLMIDEVASARDELHNEMERRCRPGEKFSEGSFVTGIASKFTTQVCKLALALHIFKFPNLLAEEQSFLSLSTWDEARALGEYFLSETLRALNLAVDNKRGQIQSIEEKLLFWLYDRHKEGKSQSKVKDIQNCFRPRGKAADEIRDRWMKKLRDNFCARETSTGEIELHPFILKNGLDWLRTQKVSSVDA